MKEICTKVFMSLHIKCFPGILTKEFNFVLVVGQSMNNGDSSTCIPYGLFHKVQVRILLLFPESCCFRLKGDFKTCLSASDRPSLTHTQI